MKMLFGIWLVCYDVYKLSWDDDDFADGVSFCVLFDVFIC